jgi:peptidoglycan/LPS O-acetylase OafA/YrhL
MKSKWGSRIPELDGIRAIAIWMVLLLHVVTGYDNPPGALAFMPRPIWLILGHGWLGVDLFFMLSGFLITGILLDSKDRPAYFKNFYIRRFLRIMPLYFAVVLVWSLCYRGHGKYFLLSSVFGANLAPLLHAGTPHGPGVLWSLAVEEHFYLLWPAIVYCLDRRKVLFLCAALIIGCPILRGIFVARGMDPEVIYVLTWFRLDGLAAGAALAIWARSDYCERRSAYKIIAALLGGLVVMSLVGARFGLFGTKTVVGVALRYTQAYLFFASLFIFTLMYRDTIWTAVLRRPFMQFTGALSYCLYLVHLSLGDLYQFLFVRRYPLPLGPSTTVLVRGAFFIGASFAIAALSRKYLEEPFLALKDKFTSRPAPTVKAELSPLLETPSA